MSKVTEVHAVKSVDVVKSDYNEGYKDRKNIKNGDYATYLLIRFEGGGYSKVRVGTYYHSNGGMYRYYSINKPELAELVDEQSSVHSSKYGATGTCTMMSITNQVSSKIAAGDIIKISGRKENTKFSFKITHAKVELLNQPALAQ